jgi:hypothetical protein
VDSTATTLPVASGSGFAVPGYATIDNEIIAICAKSGTTLTVGFSTCPNVDGRAADSTSASTHSVTAKVQQRIVAQTENQQNAEIIALATHFQRHFRSVLDFGAKCDGSTDDGPAIQSAIDWGRWKTPTNGAGIYLPRGVCVTNQNINLLGRVDLIGQNSSATSLKAGPTFPASTPVVTIGNHTDDPAGAYHAMVHDMTIDCHNVAGCTGIYSELIMEESGLKRVSVVDYNAYGVHLHDVGGGVQNWTMEDLFLYSSASATAAECVYIEGSSSSNPLQRVTCAANAKAPQPGAGIHILSATVSVSNIHCEGHADCVFFDTYGGAIAQGVYGHSSITNNIHIGAGTSGIVALGSFKNGATVNILDDGMAQRLTNGSVAFYSTSSNTTTPIVLTSDFATAQILNSIQLFGTGAHLTIGPESTPAMRFQSAYSYNMLTTSLAGLLMQRNTLTADPANGGLFLMGSGSSSSAAVGEVGGGYTSDGATFTARSSTPTGVRFSSELGGTITMFANSGETPGLAFTPAPRLRANAYGIQIIPSPSDPGCSSASHTGKVWVSDSYATAAVKVCLYSGSTWVWKTLHLE